MSLFDEALLDQARDVLERARKNQLTLATAESCTGGLIAALLTEIPGASDVFTHGFIPYANDAKTKLLGVDTSLIATHGAVSEQVARAMAQGACNVSGAGISIAVTGIAGPGGGSAQKPVGLVHFASVCGGKTLHHREIFSGNRSAIRLQAVQAALTLLARQL
jgi:nicotinamide-nucleotide amidase